ncbi:MAG: peptidoglycan bridge formation glycyltransferase FemA/FemB family protein [Eubacteriales bacterium]|nr:peptidoglycan bridge formation glycyltransferase FemA/FemB family protein [Eubacteriales bacterium]
MELRVLTSSEAESFLAQSEEWIYNQTPASLEAYRSQGGQGEILGLLEGGRVVALGKLLYYRYRKFFLSAEMNFGPVFDSSRPEILENYLRELLAYLRKQWRVIRFRLVPFLVRAKISDDLQVSPQALAPRYEEILQRQGLQRIELNYDAMPGLQASYLYVKELEGLTEDELWASLSVNCRNDMRKAERFGIKIRFLEASEVDIFNQMLRATVARTGMPEFVVNYLTPREVEIYGDQMKLPLAYLEREHSLTLLQEELASWEGQLADLTARPETKRTRGRIKEAEAAIAAAKRRLDQVNQLCDAKGELVNLACSQFTFTNSDCIYLQSAAYEEAFTFSAVYAIHKLMLQGAIEAGAKRYNMFFVSDPFAENSADASVLQFKENFKGLTLQLLGNFELKLSPIG